MSFFFSTNSKNKNIEFETQKNKDLNNLVEESKAKNTKKYTTPSKWVTIVIMLFNWALWLFRALNFFIVWLLIFHLCPRLRLRMLLLISNISNYHKKLIKMTSFISLLPTFLIKKSPTLKEALLCSIFLLWLLILNFI